MDKQARLLNNHWANLGQFPFQVAIRADSPISGTLTICSGALLNSIWVITSARCAVRSQVFHLRFNSVTHYTGGETRTSYEAHLHPNFNLQNNTNDVALIRIPQPVTGQNVRFVTLPPVTNQVVNITERVAFLTAWGRDLSGEFSPVLQYTYTHITNTNAVACRNLWDNQHQSNDNNRPNNDVICATILDLHSPRHRFCSGDSGSPLILQDNRVFTLVGLGIFNSHEDHCRNSTNLFTRISSVRNWIRSVSNV